MLTFLIAVASMGFNATDNPLHNNQIDHDKRENNVNKM